jgi:cytochrome d ubiquinol oxidase subunit II
MDQHVLSLIWFGLLGVLLIGYAILDGFDLGVGIMHLIIPKTDREKRISINSIGPLWDGNEVWLITFGGALFAAFPEAYASIFSGFYTAFFLLLFALILRAVSMEFRGKMPGERWRGNWDRLFSVGSFLATLLFGVAVGNAMIGLPLDEKGNFTGGILNQLNPYSLVTGVFAVSLFAMHGTIYLYLKTEGELQERAKSWMWRTFFFFAAMYLVTTVTTLLAVPEAAKNFEEFPVALVVPFLSVLAILNIPRAIHHGRAGYAFISSACTIAAMVFLFGVAVFPNIVRNSVAGLPSITVHSAASSEKTLSIMLLIAIIGLPFVLAYTGAIYWTFRGKTKLDADSY